MERLLAEPVKRVSASSLNWPFQALVGSPSSVLSLTWHSACSTEGGHPRRGPKSMTATPTRGSDAARSAEGLSPYGIARSTIKGTPLGPEELRQMDAYWR